jgi:histidinol-phosphatase
VSFGELGRLLDPPHGGAVADLARTAASARCYGDLAAAAMVLNGRAEAFVERGVNVWDLAPFKVLVEEAGGTFSDFAGRPTIERGEAILSNGRVHGHVVGRLGRG